MKLKKMFLGMTGLAVAAVVAHNANVFAVETFDAKTAQFDVTKVIHSNANTVDNVPVFDFNVTNVSVTGLPASSTTTVATMPTLTIAQTDNTKWATSDKTDEDYLYAKEQTVKATVNFTEMGTYTYTFKEVGSQSATNVTYDPIEYKVIFDVYKVDTNSDGVYDGLDYNCYIYDASKDSSNATNKTTAVFDNDISTTVDTYVQKKVTGAKGDTSKNFTFTITLTDDSTDHPYYIEEYNGTGWVKVANSDGTIAKENLTLVTQLKDSQRVVIKDLEVASTYKVVESDSTGYTTSIDVVNTKGTDVADGTTIENVEVYEDVNGVIFTNKNDTIINTGVILNMMPYGVVIATAAFGIFAITKSSRRQDEE